MGGKRTRKINRKSRLDTTASSAGQHSTESIETSASSTLDESTEHLNTKQKKQKLVDQPNVSTPKPDSILSHFSPLTRRKARSASTSAMNRTFNTTENTTDRPDDPLSRRLSALLPESSQQRDPVMNADLMELLRANGSKIEMLNIAIDELKATILCLQNDNDKLRKEVEASKEREEKLRSDLDSVQHRMKTVDDRNNFLEQYSRNYNLRIYNIPEPEEETATQCENTVLNLFNSKLGLRHIKKEDLDAVHRLGDKKIHASKTTSPRGIIVRFVSRRSRDEVVYNRRKLKEGGPKGRSVVIVEDLTKVNYQLYSVARHSDVTKLCWTKMGKIFIKSHNDLIKQIKSKSDLLDTRLSSVAQS